VIGEDLPALDLLKFFEIQGVIWRSCPVGAQFHNSVCEAMVKKAKRTLQYIYGDARLSTLEVETALKHVVVILNSWPLAKLSRRHGRGMRQETTSLYPEFAEP